MIVIEKAKQTCLSVLVLMLATVSISSCKKEEPAKYFGDDFLYIINQNKPINTSTLSQLHKDVIEYSYLTPMYQVEEMLFNQRLTPTSVGLPFLIQADGRVYDWDRKVAVEIEGNGKEYCVLPDADTTFIPANQRELIFNMKILRPDLSDTSMKTIQVSLKNTSDFSPEKHIWSKATYKFGNLLVQPQHYAQIQDLFGEFSKGKTYAMYYATQRKGEAYWKADPDAIVLNNFLKTASGQKVVNFENYTLLDHYYFMDLINYIRYRPANIKDAYNALIVKMIGFTKEWAKERREAGNPILDDNGNEIVFP